MKVEIHSREELEKMSKKPFRNHTSIISITDTDDVLVRLINKPKHILRLQFDDIYISELDETDYTDFPFKLFDDKMAEKIVDFVYKYKDETDLLICQCEFGESRSSAVAAAILENFHENGNGIFSNKKYCPNLYVYKILMKKFNEKI